MQMTTRSRPRAALIGLLACALLAAGGASAQVVISQSYGGGGNSGATYTHDFIELFNRGSTPVSLAGWSVQYASAAGTSWQVTPLGSHVLQPGQYYLIQQAAGGGGTTPLPTPDVIGGTAMGGTSGKVALVNSTSALSGACPTGAAIQDFLGIGGSANCFEGSGPAPGIANATAAMRDDAGCTDSNDNAADFSTAAPTPRNSSNLFHACGGAPTAPVFVFDGATVSVLEGDSAAAMLTFVANFAPAIGSGDTVSFDIAVSGPAGRYAYTGPASVTLDDSAATPYLIKVETVPNTVTDGNATITITLSNFSGADLSQADPISKSGTIIDDDISFTPISQIQGAGQVSPLDGQVVTTRGIVTAITSNSQRYYLQSLAGDEDANPATSEGLLVFGPASNPAATGLAVGDRVQVTGTVSEYGAAGSLPITELTFVTTTVISSGNALPVPAVLDGTDLDPAGPLDALERYEFMRVSVPRFITVSPTGAGANDEFFGVTEGTQRPMREAGVDRFRCGVDPALPGSMPLPAEAPANVPCWDNNPELLRVKTNLLAGGSAKTLRSGTLLENLVGVLDYASARYTILTRDSDFPVPDTSAAASGTAVSAASPTEITVGGYNVENLAQAGGVTYTRKADKIAQTIVNYLGTPDVLGLIEVANPETLDDIAARVGTIAANDPEYGSVMVAVAGTQRLGLLLKKALIGGQPRVTVVGTPTEYGAGLHVLCPDGVSYTAGLLNDRPPLVVDLLIRGPNGASVPITVINNHLKSMIDVDSAADADANYACFNDPLNPGGGEGRRNRAKRQQNAEFLAELVQQFQNADPGRAIVLVGDFNAYEFNDGYADLMGTIKGEPSANDQTVVPDDGVDLVAPDLILLTELAPRDERYSYTFAGNAQTIDQILVNEAALSRTAGEPRMEFARVNADFHQADRNDTGNAFGNSDHDPALAFLDIAAFRTADVSVSGTSVAASANVGDTLTYAFTLANTGADAAVGSQVILTLPAGLGFTALTAPAGWVCSQPAAGASGAIQCGTASLAAGASASFSVTAGVLPAAAGQTLTATLAASTASTDPQPGNNGHDFMTQVAAGSPEIFADGFED